MLYLEEGLLVPLVQALAKQLDLGKRDERRGKERVADGGETRKSAGDRKDTMKRKQKGDAGRGREIQPLSCSMKRTLNCALSRRTCASCRLVGAVPAAASSPGDAACPGAAACCSEEEAQAALIARSSCRTRGIRACCLR